jgi:predicted amidohydrolase YtcJ
MAADYVFLNAEVITVNPRDDIAQAVAVKGNEVCAVGTNQLGVDCKNGVGSIEVGKLTDLVALDGSMLSSSPEQILSIKPTLTMIDGEIVFESEGDRAPGERSQLAPAAHPAD